MNLFKLNSQNNTFRLVQTGRRGIPGVGVPSGGTTGQVLAKESNTDFDTEWITPPTAPVTSVNGQTGVVVLDKDDVGLGNVDNTSDLNKPISTATQNALDDKLDTAGGTMTGNIDMNNNIITGITDVPTDDSDATNKAYVDNAVEEDWFETGAGTDIDWGIPLLDVTVAQDWVPSFVNPPEETTGAHVTIRVTMDGTFTITWPPEIQWETGTAPAPADGEQIIVEVLRRSYTDVYAWVVSNTTPVAYKTPGEIAGLVQHLDAHEDADSLILAPAEDVAELVQLYAFLSVEAYGGDRLRTWTAEVGNDAEVEVNPNPFFNGLTNGPAVLTDPDGRRGLLFTTTGRCSSNEGALLFPSVGSILTTHTIVLVLGPAWTGNEVGTSVGYGTNGCALSNDHPVAPLGDDYIFDYNNSNYPAALGARWQENGSGTSNRPISDPRSAPDFPDVYATRYDGTNWDFFRRSGRVRLDRYSQANIDLNAGQWGVASTPQRVLPFKGVIHEVIIYDNDISDEDLIALMDGLTDKWRL